MPKDKLQQKSLMEKTKFIIYGASGHAKVLIEAIKSRFHSHEIRVYDDDKQKQTCLGIPVQHDLSKLFPLRNLVFGIGDNHIRKQLAQKLIEAGFAPAIIHKKATCSRSAIIKKGSVLFAKSVINAEAIIGQHCIINTGAIVEHDCILEDYVHISPNATLAGGVYIGEGTHVGMGAQIIQGIKIGKWCTIGAGAVIIRDIPDGAKVVGNPGRMI